MDDVRVLGRYRLIERIASGGAAEVWRARDEQLDRFVAVKRLHAHLLPDRSSRLRLAAEARAAAGLSHPVVVGVYDVDVEGDAPALVMELVDGESLASRIARTGPLPAAEAALLAADLADALFHAHQRGVIHRDVKPGNVLIARDGRTRLVDFGIAHSLADAAARLTQTGTVIGTLRSMAPEQLAAGSITPRTDLYGLGVVLYESLTGRPPFDASTPLVLAESQRAGPPPLEGIDPALASIVASCLAYDPADRPLHAGALAAALRGWAAGGATTVVAPPVSVAATSVPSASVAPARIAPVEAPAAHPRRPRRFPIWLAAVAAAAALLLVGWIAAGMPAPNLVSASPPPTPTRSAVPTSAPAATPLPEWADELAAKVAEDCGDDATTAEALAAMGEDAAEEVADALIEGCRDRDDDEAGGNGGDGRGNGGQGGGNGDEGGGNGDEGGGNGTRGRDG